MKAHSFTSKRGRSVAEPDPGINPLSLMRQFSELGCETAIDPTTGIVAAWGWRINTNGRRENVMVDAPQLSQWPMGILFSRGLVTQDQIDVCGIHTWAYGIAFPKKSSTMMAMEYRAERDDGAEQMGRLSELGTVCRSDDLCRAAIHKAFMRINREMMARGPHIHGAINSLVVYEVRPSWWLDTKMPEKTQGYRWTKSGLKMLEDFWPDAVTRMHHAFCS